MLEVENFNLIKAQKKKNNVKERGLNAKQRTKRVNNIYWLKGEIEFKKSNISQKNPKQKPNIKIKMIKFEIKTK